MKTMYLWSWRYSTARGWHWKAEREVTQESAQGWLEAFGKDEPQVRFVVAQRKPREL